MPIQRVHQLPVTPPSPEEDSIPDHVRFESHVPDVEPDEPVEYRPADPPPVVEEPEAPPQTAAPQPPPTTRRNETTSDDAVERRYGLIATRSPSISVMSESLVWPRRETLGIRPRFGASYAAVADMATWSVGLGLTYTFDPRVMIELRGDFEMPVVDDASVNRLSSVWLSLNLIWYFYVHHFVQPYLIAGASMAIAPSAPNTEDHATVAGGGQAGIGLEILLLHERMGVSFEAIGFVAGIEGEVLEGGVMATGAVSFYL